MRLFSLVRRHLGGWPDDDLTDHVRVHRADIRVLARRREGVGEGLVGVETSHCRLVERAAGLNTKLSCRP